MADVAPHPSTSAPTTMTTGGGNNTRPPLVIPTGTEDVEVGDWDEILAGEDSQIYDILDIIVQEHAAVSYIVLLVEECWRVGKMRVATELLHQALNQRPQEDHVPLLCMLATYKLALARQAPKLILQKLRNNGKAAVRPSNPDHPESVNPDQNAPPKTKEQYWNESERLLQDAETLDRSNKTVRDCRAALALARNDLDLASSLFDQILLDEPSHLIATLGRARCLFAKRQFRPALKLYQHVLTVNPKFLPDPRIGIGLCLYMLGDKDKAKRAWARTLVVHPDEPTETVSASVLLGLAHLNSHRDPSFSPSSSSSSFDNNGNTKNDDDDNDAAIKAEYAKGLQYLTAAFKKNNTVAAAMNPLANHFLNTGAFDKAIKLAERAVQYADAKALLAEGYFQIGRILDLEDDRNPAIVESFDATLKVNPEHLVAKLALTQTFIKRSQIPAALNLLDGILRKQPRCLEALVLLGSIHTHQTFTSFSIVDSTHERKKAKEVYDTVSRLLVTETRTSARARQVAEDVEFYLEVARLWDDDVSPEKSLGAYREAEKIELAAAASEGEGEGEGNGVRPALVNNIAVLEFARGDRDAAAAGLEEALRGVGKTLEKAGGTMSDELDAVLTTVSFNLGVVYEAEGETEKAIEAYSQILSRHPEFVDAKARLALLAIKAKELNKADSLIKEALTSHLTNNEVRALYTYYAHKFHSTKAALDFTIETLKNNKPTVRQDVYALCAAGSMYFQAARENKDPSREAMKDKAAKFFRSVEYYDKALKLDPQCAFAAQGLAISIAEGTIGTGVEVTATTPAGSEAAQRAKNTRDALAIFTKVKESLNEGSVYVNIGHCHFMRDEWDRAIENYTTASKKYFHDKDVGTLMYLARTWYQKGVTEKNFAHLQSCLAVTRQALALMPDDLTILYNVAMILQRGLQVLDELRPSQRTMADLEAAIANCEESNTLFQRLDDDKTEVTPYPKEQLKQRLRFGTNMLKKAQETLKAQDAHDQVESARVEEARRKREAERQRLAEIEEVRLAEIARQAEQLAAQRKIMREEAAMWAAKEAEIVSDEEEKKKKKGEGKKRTKKAKKEDGESTGEEEDRPAKKKGKKAKKEKRESQMDVDGEESDEQVRAIKRKPAGRGGKAFKSTEFIDSEEDSDGGSAPPDDAGSPRSAVNENYDDEDDDE